MTETNHADILTSLRAVDVNLITFNKTMSILEIIGKEDIQGYDATALIGVFDRGDTVELFNTLSLMLSFFINLKVNGQHILSDLSTLLEKKECDLTNEEVFSIIQANVAAPRN